MWFVVLLLIVAAVVVIYLKKQTKKSTSKGAKAQRKAAVSGVAETAKDYKGIGIVCEDDACAAAKALRGKRYLVAEAPHVPLSDCDKNCQCRYEHYPDRRNPEGDRRSNFGMASDLHGSTAQERRVKRGRRKSDRQRFQ